MVHGEFLAIILGIAFFVLWICCHTLFRVPMDYDFDDIDRAKAYFDLADKWLALNDNQKFVRIYENANLEKRQVEELLVESKWRRYSLQVRCRLIQK